MIGRWTKALLDGNEEYPHDMSTDKRVKQIKRIAVMNLKKEGGTSRTSGNELLDSVKSQHDKIYDEIEQYPDWEEDEYDYESYSK